MENDPNQTENVPWKQWLQQTDLLVQDAWFKLSSSSQEAVTSSLQWQNYSMVLPLSLTQYCLEQWPHFHFSTTRTAYKNIRKQKKMRQQIPHLL